MTNIEALLKNQILIEIENEISAYFGCKILRSNRELIISTIEHDILVSNLTIDNLDVFINENKKTIIDFGILLLKNDTPNEGIYFGFSILYATYLIFLVANNKNSLLAFLKSLRIPKAKLFLKHLYEIKVIMAI
jgi:hypothetical protein